MGTLGKKVQRIRSKNAGPFWITIDIFCGSKEVYQEVLKNLDNRKIVELFKIPGQTLKRFEIEDLNVLKFSFPRQIVQGHIKDRDMHGAQLAVLLSETKFQS